MNKYNVSSLIDMHGKRQVRPSIGPYSNIFSLELPTIAQIFLKRLGVVHKLMLRKHLEWGPFRVKMLRTSTLRTQKKKC